MMNNRDLITDKCSDIIHRLSSRIEQNQSAMVDNCETMVPLCIEKSFYQYKGDIGQGCCVEVCDKKLLGSYRHQFTSSKMFDNKSEYIDYIVNNVLHQVVNHIPFNSLYQLSCCLPQNVENMLCHTDMDSDRLIRILVTDVLQSHGTKTRQVTDWYAFANLIKPLLPSGKAEDDDLESRTKISSTQNKLSKQVKSSEGVLSSKTSLVKKRPSTDTHMSSANRLPSTSVTPQIMSTTDTIAPTSINSKEQFTPVGAKYHSKTKSIQKSVSNKTDTIDPVQSLPFREISTNLLSSITLRTEDHILSDPPLHDHKSSKSSDRSSSSDCVLTIHHKYKHKEHQNHHTTISFDKPVSRTVVLSHPSVATAESVQKSKHTLVDTPSIITDEKPTHKTSRQSSTNTKGSKASDLFKLLSSSDNASKYLHQISFQETLDDTILSSSSDEQEISHSINAVPMYDDSILDNSENDTSSSNSKNVRMDTNLTRSKKKVTRVNHYPNMLADFD